MNLTTLPLPRAASWTCGLLWLACATVSVATAETQEVLLHNFAGPPPYGATPWRVIRDSAGNLYGTTYSGGAFNQGVVFKVDTSGNMIVLHSFAGGADGANPTAGVSRDSAGNLYGTTYYGGMFNAGTVFKVDPSGNETVLYGGAGIAFPQGVIVDSAGDLYGTNYDGGTWGFGSVYKLDSSGHLTVLYSFSFTGSDGANPLAGVIRDSAGNLYGTTLNGGEFGKGTVYMVDPSGSETVLHSFSGADGAGANASVILSSGDLYGTTTGGGPSSNGCGVVYKLDASGHETVLHSFTGGADGCNPTGGVIRDSAGNLYGTTAYGGTFNAGTVYKLDTSGNETLLYNFTQVPVTNGVGLGSPGPTGVVLDPAGNLYGTTLQGGTTDLGVLFQLTPSGHETVLHNFTGYVDGADPFAGLTRDSRGNLYGTTARGGTDYVGVVFKLAPTGAETVLHTFTFGGADGRNPTAGVVLDSAGNLYGTTLLGGPRGAGIVYRLAPSGAETVLYTFIGVKDGFDPGGVTLDSAGNLYGTAQGGGTHGLGTVYKLDASGNFTVLHDFDGLDGSTPSSGPILDSAGNLYGTTEQGGEFGQGTVYKLDTSGNETVLYSFFGYPDGKDPYAGVILDSAGNLYGTTVDGGAFNRGTVYKLDTSGNETVLHSFGGRNDGAYPYGGVILDAADNLYGSTSQGGIYGQGVAFRLTRAGSETILHSFMGGADGSNPEASLILGPDGILYGTTAGGAETGGGVVFELKE